MIVDLPRRWGWVIGVATGFVVALAVVFVIATRPPGDALIAQAAAVVRSTALASADVAPSDAEPAIVDVGSAHGADQIQVCGGAWVTLREDGTADPGDLAQAMDLPQTRAQILAALQVDPAELSQAAARVLVMTAPDESVAHLPDGTDCMPGVDCPPTQAHAAAVAQARDAVVRMAASSTDPRVYALGVKLCANAADAGACQLLSARQWAQLDPGNASPWLYLLHEAKVRGDRDAQDEALHRMATAQRSDSAFFATAGAIAAAAPATDAALPATLALIERAINTGASPPAGYTDVLAACKGDALRDSNRAQTCAAIVDVLVERSTTLIDRTIGLAIGKNVGWPADRLDVARAETHAYQLTGVPAWQNSRDQNFGCAPLRQEIGRMQRFADVGEIVALREWVAQSGRSADSFLQAERERASIAAAASAPSVSVAGSASTP